MIKKTNNFSKIFISKLEETLTQYSTEFAGMPIEIEIITGANEDKINKLTGEQYTREYQANYGFFPGIIGNDGESLDLYLLDNPKEDAKVYIIHQLDYKREKFDEDKVMLGFNERKDAVKMWGIHNVDPDIMFGAVSTFTLDEFKKHLVRIDQQDEDGVLIADNISQNYLDKKGFLKEVAYQGAYTGNNTYVSF